jgi:LysR family transcriptional regulator, transcriptional activator of nhaA
MRRPWVNYHHLLYFKTIAIEGGIANAAKKLRLGQPTLSTQLKQFEDSLGHVLFDRKKKRLQLTEAGKLILSYANEIFKMGDEMVDALNDRHLVEKVQIQIGANDHVPKHLALKVFEFAASQFDCLVAMEEGHGDQLLRELRAHRTDLVISNYSPPVGEAGGFYAKCVTKMQVVICGAPKYARLKRNFPASLVGQPMIMPSVLCKLRQDVEHLFKLQEISTNVVAEVQDTSLQKLMGIHGHGLIPIAEPAIAEHVANKELVVIGTLPGVYEELWLIAAQRKLDNPVAAAIMKRFSL